MSSDDADEYLNEIAQGNPSNVNDFRIMTTTMEKVNNKIIKYLFILVMSIFNEYYIDSGGNSN
jgi:hypothetical protein